VWLSHPWVPWDIPVCSVREMKCELDFRKLTFKAKIFSLNLWMSPDVMDCVCLGCDKGGPSIWRRWLRTTREIRSVRFEIAHPWCLRVGWGLSNWLTCYQFSVWLGIWLILWPSLVPVIPTPPAEFPTPLTCLYGLYYPDFPLQSFDVGVSWSLSSKNGRENQIVPLLQNWVKLSQSAAICRSRGCDFPGLPSVPMTKSRPSTLS
jgi:hypothetical protein